MIMRIVVIFGLLSVAEFVPLPESDELINIGNSGNFQTAFNQEGEGSGEEPIVTVTTTTTKPVSSIKGIPYFKPNFSKWNQFYMPGGREYRRKQTPITEYNNDNKAAKSFLGNVLSMIGFNTDETPMLKNPEKTLMQALYNTSKAMVIPTQKSRYASHSLIQENTCIPSIEASRSFRIAAFMGKWYQVMATMQQGDDNTCRMMSYRMLNSQPDEIGATFETIEYNNRPGSYGNPHMTSGFGRQNSIKGEIRFNSILEDTLVNVVHVGPVNSAGYYQYVILGANCYYPIRVYARDPEVFKRKYQAEAFRILGKKGMINDISRALNFIKVTDFNACSFPPNFFAN